MTPSAASHGRWRRRPRSAAQPIASKRALEGDDLDAASREVAAFEQALGEQQVSQAALTSAQKGITELEDALGPDAYWKARTWKRLVAIGAGPAANIALTVVLFTFLFLTVAGKATPTVATVAPEIESGVVSPAQKMGLQAGDRVVAINGKPVVASEIAETIAGSGGKPLTLTVVRHGARLNLGPVAARLVDDRYRLGFGLEGSGMSPVPAFGNAVKVTGLVSREIVKSLGRLVTGKGRDQVSSPIGITRASSDAVQQGTDNYLWVLGLVSLSLALLNLLPLLPLDGGHILFTLIEGARGRFLRREIYERVSMVGLALVLLLFFVGLSNDIGKLLLVDSDSRYPLGVSSEVQIRVGDVAIGGGAPVVVQSMTLTKTHDVPATTAQIAALASAGCEVVRVAVPKNEDAAALPLIVRLSPIPVIADIHFNASLAVKAIAAGVAAVRINPGNIGGPEKVEQVVSAAKNAGIPMRIGANSGSLPKHLFELAQKDQAEALVAAALEEVELLERLEYRDFKISVKATHVPTMIRAYRMLSAKVPYPLHLGVTESGTEFAGAIKSSVGIGSLLADGIGDTIRVSLTADPVKEVEVAWEILKALGLRERGPVMIACPSCGRDNVGVETLARAVEDRLRAYPEAFEVAVMGCAVNGPGEAGDADFGIAGGRESGFVYAHGRVLKKVPSEALIDELFVEIDRWLADGMKRPKRLKMAKPAALAMAEASLIPLD